MSLNFESLWNNFAPQFYFILVFCGVIAGFGALLTRGAGAMFGTLLIVVGIGVMFAILGNLQAIAEWFSKMIVKTGLITPPIFEGSKAMIRGVFRGI